MCASVLILGLLRVRVFNSDPMLALAVRFSVAIYGAGPAPRKSVHSKRCPKSTDVSSGPL